MQMNNDTWELTFKESEDYKKLKDRPIAYFSAEYALSPTLPIYAGGLGILAGDVVKEAGENDFPMIFIGLFYKKGQNDIILQEGGDNKEIDLVSNAGEPVIISIPISNRQISFQVWHWSTGGANVYLLDTDVTQNTPEDRAITERLYVEDRELRLKQEILLGIGGFRFLRHLLGLHPSVYHLNEGHSAFLALELVHHEMLHQRVDFVTASAYAKKHILFTNHTLVPAGQELFASTSVSSALEAYAKEIEVPIEDIVKVGLLKENPDLFSMTNFSFYFAGKSNSVSVLHGQKALLVWPEYPMENITNGIYLPRWDSVKSEEDLWGSHQSNKIKLLKYIKENTGETWDENVLVFGWGRRLVPYKQPGAFIEDVEAVMKLAGDSQRPFKIVFSGPTNDQQESELLIELKKTINEKLKGVAVFLPHFNIDLATLMVSGVDVWLNTPIVGREACGTSGMKAGLNGVLSLSTKDGWVAEADLSKCGWVVDETENLSSSLLDITERDILPLYYQHLQNTENSTWLSYMRNARTLIKNEFSTNRALREYTEKCYIPQLHKQHTHKYQ
jgi:glucan phosphorylase